MNRQTLHKTGSVIIAIAALTFVAALLFATPGCKPASPSPSVGVAVLLDTSDKIAEATAHNATMGRKIQDAPKSPVVEIKPTVELQAKALAEAKEQIRAMAAAKEASDRQWQGKVDAANLKATKAEGRETSLRSDPYVRVALWVEWFVKLLIALWFILGVAGVLLTVFGGGGIWFDLGRHILAFLPLANLFTTGANLVGRRIVKAAP